MRRRVIVVLVLATLGCASRSLREALTPIPERAPLEVVPDQRGDEAAANAISSSDQIAIASVVISSFFRPTPGQARWIDPQLLSHRRTPAADSLGEVEFEWATAVADAVGRRRVCALDVADESCRGLPGGVLRFSNAYATGPDAAVVFVRYTPVGRGERPPAGDGFELEFDVARRGSEWRVVSRRTNARPT